jgi:FixJ family two-component response regulator
MTIKTFPQATFWRAWLRNATCSFPVPVSRIGHVKKTPVISIIDDDSSVRTATESLMRSLGFVAHTFASAEEFLQSRNVDETSCLISDVQMPHMSGIELQSRLLARDNRTPIIFITAFPDENVQTRALKAGAVCFLVKPVDGQTLLNCLDEALKRHDRMAGDD